MAALEIINCNNKCKETDIDYYNKAASYWEGVKPTIDGMLGGYAKISHIDIDGSNKLLKCLFKDDACPDKTRALDCGAGIGRITKHLLSKHFQTVDLVEQDQHFLEKAKVYLEGNQNVGNLYCAGLQNFSFPAATYDVIWFQWVLGHLTDEHLVELLVRCSPALRPNGVIIIKENVTSSGKVEEDDEDSSVTRPQCLLRSLFKSANLDIVKEFKQNKFPKDIYEVDMFVLRPKFPSTKEEVVSQKVPKADKVSPENNEQLSGQVVHLRRLSKRMMFVDIFIENDVRKSLAFKFWQNAGMFDKVNRGQYKLHVGDLVCFTGVWEKDLFTIGDYEILKKWSDNSGGKAFIPLPPPSVSINEEKSNQDLPCKFFVNTGKCDVQDCRFRHIQNEDALKLSRKEFVTERIQKRLLVHESEFDLKEVESGTKRFEQFATWIENKYGRDYLKSGIILDVAGGRGNLAFELAVKLGFNCQSVDPRPQKLKRWQYKYLKKHPQSAAPPHHTTMFDLNFFSRTGIVPENVRLITGLHPDEVTEVILDTGLQFNIPVSIVPCCVFSAMFPDRKLRSNDTSPTSYDQFLQFLKEKSDTIESDFLPFMGKNQVLYTKILT